MMMIATLFNAPLSALLYGTAKQPQPTPTPSPSNSDIGKVTEKVTEEVSKTVYGAGPLLGTLLTVGIAALVALAVTVVGALVLRQVFRRSPRTLAQARKMRTPLFLAVFFMSAKITLSQIPIHGFTLVGAVQWVLLFSGLGCIAWLLINAARTFETAVLARYENASVTDRRARKLKTQAVLIRRILIVLIVVLMISIALLTIPQVRAVGAGIMASAGILSVIAGLAVQSSLANIFAGLQIVFTDALRVGDVVDVEEYFGTVEDITLTYVVVKIWDERRIIYPSTFFTSNPFTNYTRTGSAAMGTVEFNLDWNVPVDAMRQRLTELLSSTELWDKREKSIQVTEALNGMIKVRVVVSAANTGNLWDLRALVREDMINFLRSEHPQAMVQQRFQTSESCAEGFYLAPGYLETGTEPANTGAGALSDSATGANRAEQTGERGQTNKSNQPASSAAGQNPAGATPPASAHPETSSHQAGAIEETEESQHWHKIPRLDTLDDVFAEGTPARGSLPKVVAKIKNLAGHGNKNTPENAQEAVPAPSPKTDHGPYRSGPHTTGQIPHTQPHSSPVPLTTPSPDSAMFTGSITALERGLDYLGPGEEAYKERQERQERGFDLFEDEEPTTGQLPVSDENSEEEQQKDD